MTPIALLITGALQVCLAPVLIIGRRRIADWLADHIPPLDVASFRGHGEHLLALGGVGGAISGGFFLAFAMVSLSRA